MSSTYYHLWYVRTSSESGGQAVGVIAPLKPLPSRPSSFFTSGNALNQNVWFLCCGGILAILVSKYQNSFFFISVPRKFPGGDQQGGRPCWSSPRNDRPQYLFRLACSEIMQSACKWQHLKIKGLRFAPGIWIENSAVHPGSGKRKILYKAI